MPGQMINAPTTGVAGETQFIALSENDSALFDGMNEGSCSEVFKVPNDGQGVMLTAFCLTKPLYIEMVKVDIQDIPSGGPDCCTCQVESTSALKPQTLSNAECVTQLTDGNRGVWGMGYGVSMGVLTMPGSYRLCCDKPCDLSGVVVCAKLISASSMANVPSQLIFGNTK